MPRAAHLTTRNTPVRSSAIDSSTARQGRSCVSLPRRLSPGKWIVFLAMVLAAPSTPGGADCRTKRQGPGASVSTVPLGRFVPKDNLILYVEFAGTNSHADSWKKTAAYRMLNETPLGEMLETVGGQLLDKAARIRSQSHAERCRGRQALKHAGTYGCVVAINANPKGGESAPLQGTIVLRGGGGKEIRAVTSRLLRRFMGTASPKIEQKGAAHADCRTGGGPSFWQRSHGGWAWWAEQTDLVVAFPAPAGADAIIAAIDGKAPSALEHP